MCSKMKKILAKLLPLFACHGSIQRTLGSCKLDHEDSLNLRGKLFGDISRL